MFKTKEDIIQEKYGSQIQTNNWEQVEKIEAGAYSEGIDATFKSFTERVEFYKKYRNNDWCNELRNYWTTRPCGISWNDWLFDYCFGDVIE